MPQAGEVLGHFRLESQLGRGGMGEVWLANDLRLERRVAIKLLRDEQRLRPGARERMLREARALSRVEHPAICQIYEILELEDADALVLEFVEGKTLAAVPLESLTSLEKLQIGIEIAEALSVAHRHGIVHRDLKAENIMIDSKGEVKVLDFGVARFVAGTELPPLLAENPNLKETQEAVGSFGFSDVRDFQTRRGVIVGTLHAMSPEQARGEEITAASDLFSLGLLLQEIFTGKPAYPVDLELPGLYPLVAAGTPLPRDGLEPDLDRLIGELLQLEPERRPPAAQVAERLRWIADKPARLAAQRRRRRLVVAALVVLTVALAVVTALAYSASQARDLARRRQLQAEELITFLLKDLKEPLEAVGKLDLLSAVSQRALSYFRSVREAELSFTERIRQLEALQLLAQIEMARGQLQSARQILLQALEANPPLSGLSEPERGALYLARSRLWFLLGSLDLEAPEPEDRQRALGAFMEAYREAQLGAEHLPENPNLQEELASAASGLGIALRSNGRLAEAVIHLKEAADRFEKLVAANPQDRLKLRSALVDTLGWLSSTHFELGQLKEAFAVREKQVVPLKLLTDLEPNNRIFRNDLSVAETHLAVLLEGTGRLDDAIRTQQQALIHAEQLVAFEPDNAEWRRNWVLSQGHLGHYLFLAGRSEAAQPLLKKSVGELVQLGRERPDLRIWPRFEAVHRIRLARVEAALGHPSEAQEELRRARKLLGPFQAGDPKQWDPLFTLAFAHLALAEVELLEFGSAADPETEKLAEILEALRAPATARNFRAQDLRARLLIALGRAEEARQEVSWLLNQGWASSGFREAVRASALQDLLQASSADGP